jgi:hypothetical protein
MLNEIPLQPIRIAIIKKQQQNKPPEKNVLVRMWRN